MENHSTFIKLESSLETINTLVLGIGIYDILMPKEFELVEEDGKGDKEGGPNSLLGVGDSAWIPLRGKSLIFGNS